MAERGGERALHERVAQLEAQLLQLAKAEERLTTTVNMLAEMEARRQGREEQQASAKDDRHEVHAWARALVPSSVGLAVIMLFVGAAVWAYNQIQTLLGP